MWCCYILRSTRNWMSMLSESTFCYYNLLSYIINASGKVWLSEHLVKNLSSPVRKIIFPFVPGRKCFGLTYSNYRTRPNTIPFVQGNKCFVLTYSNYRTRPDSFPFVSGRKCFRLTDSKYRMYRIAVPVRLQSASNSPPTVMRFVYTVENPPESLLLENLKSSFLGLTILKVNSE